MMSTAPPRIAEFEHIRVNARGTTLIAVVTRGPKTELHREVHIPLTQAHLPQLRQAIAALEAAGTGIETGPCTATQAYGATGCT